MGTEDFGSEGAADEGRDQAREQSGVPGLEHGGDHRKAGEDESGDDLEQRKHD